MTRTVLLIALLLTVGGCINRDPNQSHQELTAQQQQEKIQRCTKLRKQIDELKGSPVRRTTAREYYAKECLEQSSDTVYK